MCGIVGYIGNKEAYPILIKGLYRLEYRGYDSAGIALISDNEITMYKTKGKVKNLEILMEGKNHRGNIGIAHTRWATHGEPNDVNAHPHFSESKCLALIHNGIIENYKSLKTELISIGKAFASNTDTEVLIQMIEFMHESHNTDLFTAVQMALNYAVGAYAIAVIDKRNPDIMIVARKGSPLIIGVGKKEYFVASDASPLVEYTNKVIYLEEEQIAVLSKKEGIKIRSLKNIEVTPVISKLDMEISQLEKSGFAHYMLKEIFEQPQALINTLKGRLNNDTKEVKLSGIIDNVEKFKKAKRIIICACGTSWHAGMIGKYIIEELARIPVEVEYSSEFRYRNPVIYKNDIVIAISQSGETADTLAAMQLAKEKGAFLFGICNVVGSSIARATDTGAYTHVGPEIGVASTKAFTAQLSTLFLFAICIAYEKKSISKALYCNLIDELQQIPQKISKILDQSERIKELSSIFTYAKNFIYLGRGYNYPVALEGALKLKEISYIHAEGYPAAEMKHGAIALIDEEMPIVVIATKRGNYEKIVNNIEEIKARKGLVISIINEGDVIVKNLSDYYIEIPDTEECFAPILSVIPLQLMSYYIAVAKKRDVDQPRNLAKSVTVE